MSDVTETPADAAPQGAREVNDPPPPELVDFEILKLIGEGTFGKVWLAQERVSGVYRAIKVFPKTARDTEIAGLCEFQRRHMYHPSLLQILVVGQQGETYYVVMELADDIKGSVALDPQYYETCSLERLISDRGALPPEEALADLKCIIDGIDYLHAQGLVHRDIKPSNVLYINNRPKLCDFGLLAPGHAAVDRAGTHGYWRPDGPTDRDSDLYAMTKVAFQMFTGSEVSRFSELPSDLAKTTSPEMYRGISELLEKGCADNPAKRFGSAQAMLAHVERLHRPADADRVAAGGGKSSRFEGWSSTVLLTFLVVALIVLGLFVTRRPAAQPKAPLAELKITTFPDDRGDPNSPDSFISQTELATLSGTISTSARNLRVPRHDIRYAKAGVVSEPASHMVIFWIPPEGFIHMRTSGDRQRSFTDPELRFFRHLRGNSGNYVICVLLHDRPIPNPEVLRNVIGSMRDERIWPELPPRSMRIFGADQTTPYFVSAGDETGEYGASGFGLLGHIRNKLTDSYVVLGVEIPLPKPATQELTPPESAEPTTQDPASSEN